MDTKEIELKLSEMGLTLESEFIPWSKSRNAGEKYPSLNWKVTLLKNGKKILSTDYMAGSGHCPSYQQRETVDSHRLVLEECERGKSFFPNKALLPKFADVMYSLLMDADVLEYDFEDWCANFGYEEDSRKAEKIYKDCQDIALKLVRSIGSDGISTLRDLFQDY